MINGSSEYELKKWGANLKYEYKVALIEKYPCFVSIHNVILMMTMMMMMMMTMMVIMLMVVMMMMMTTTMMIKVMMFMIMIRMAKLMIVMVGDNTIRMPNKVQNEVMTME